MPFFNILAQVFKKQDFFKEIGLKSIEKRHKNIKKTGKILKKFSF